jgi:hypothetical protein
MSDALAENEKNVVIVKSLIQSLVDFTLRHMPDLHFAKSSLLVVSKCVA